MSKQVRNYREEKNSGALSYVLESSIKSLESDLETSRFSNPEKQAELESKLEEARKNLKESQESIRSQIGLERTYEEMERYDHLIQRIETGKFSLIDIEILESSKLKPFFDESFSHKLEEAKAAMQARASSYKALSKKEPELERQANSDWLNHVSELETDIDKLKSEAERIKGINFLELDDDQVNTLFDNNDLAKFIGIKNEIAGLNNKTKNWVKRNTELEAQLEPLIQKAKAKRTKKIQEEIRYKDLEIQKGKNEWVKMRSKELGLKQSKAFDFSGCLDQISILKLDEMIKEFRNIEQERIYKHLGKNLNEIYKDLNSSQLPANIKENIKVELDKAGSRISSRSVGSISQLKQTLKDLEKGQLELKESIKEIDHYEKNRPEIVEKALEDHEKLSAELKKITPEMVDRIKLGLSREGVTEPIILKQIKYLEALADPSSEMRRGIADWERNILPHISEIPVEELQAFVEDLANYSRMIPLKDMERFLNWVENEDYQSAKAAHLSIEGLKEAKNIKQIKTALKKSIGLETLDSPHLDEKGVKGDPSQHVKILSSKDFARYTKYTNGKMVYHERMSASGTKEWYIFVDESAFQSNQEKNVNELKRQLTQELFHVEFERGGTVQDEDGNIITLKQKLEKDFVTDNPELWGPIRKAFVKWMKSTGELDSHGKEEWPDVDILSELFSLQNELGIKRIEKETLSPKELLNNLLFDFKQEKAARKHDSKIGKTLAKYSRTLGAKDGVPIDHYDPKSKEGIPTEEAGPVDLNDPQFSIPSTETQAVPVDSAKQAEIQGQIDAFKQRLNGLKDSSYLQKIKDAPELIDSMILFNEETERLNQNEDIDAAISRNKELEEDIQTVEGAVNDLSVNEANTDMSFIRNMWNNTTFFSLQDFVMAGKQFGEYWSRRMNRRVEDHAARINMAVFGGGGMGLEAAARQQKTEAAEVGEWEGNIDKFDPFQLEGLMASLAKDLIPDRDRFKAILRTLAKKGRLNWLNQDIWKILNKLQNTVYFREGDPELLSNPNLLRLKLIKALGNFYDQDEYPGLESGNNSKYESEKTSMEAAHQKTPTILTRRLDEILAKKRTDGNYKANPHEYESLIDYCVNQGRSNGEAIMFYLIAGMAEGLLTPERGLNLSSKYQSKWPPIQWFETVPPSQSFFKELCEKNFPEDYAEGNVHKKGRGEKFRQWFFTEAINKFAISDRVSKSVKNKAWDPDWSRTITCMADAETIRQHFSGQGGTNVLQAPAIAQSFVGTLQYLEENAINPAFVKKADFARIAANIVMHEGIVDATAYRSPNDVYSRQVDNNREPNEAKSGRYGGQSLAVHREKLTNFLAQIDPDIFQLLRGRDLTDGRENREIGQKVSRLLVERFPGIENVVPNIYPPDKIDRVDKIFDKIREIMAYIFNNMSKEKYEELLKYVAENAGKV